VQLAVPLAEVTLRDDRLPLALFFGADSQVKRTLPNKRSSKRCLGSSPKCIS
jgi:hypothetical protein